MLSRASTTLVPSELSENMAAVMDVSTVALWIEVESAVLKEATVSLHIYIYIKKLHGLSPRANYTDLSDRRLSAK
jgi:hypothetical protein